LITLKESTRREAALRGPKRSSQARCRRQEIAMPQPQPSASDSRAMRRAPGLDQVRRLMSRYPRLETESARRPTTVRKPEQTDLADTTPGERRA
jgi:hypothetical protein